MYTLTNPSARPPYLGEAPPAIAPRCRRTTPALILDGFEVGDYRLRPDHHNPLTSLADWIKLSRVQGRNYMLRVEGHADSSGPEVMNRRLSFRRATEVRNFLRSKAVGEWVDQVPRGESSPRASNTTPDGRRKNRRVEIYLCLLPRP